MTAAGAKIIEGLKDAVAGNFSAVTIEGQRWIRAPEWQPIRAAPKKPLDKHGYGPTILLWVEGELAIGFWDRDFKKFFIVTVERHPQPSHWMPFPEPPVSA